MRPPPLCAGMKRAPDSRRMASEKIIRSGDFFTLFFLSAAPYIATSITPEIARACGRPVGQADRVSDGLKQRRRGLFWSLPPFQRAGLLKRQLHPCRPCGTGLPLQSKAALEGRDVLAVCSARSRDGWYRSGPPSPQRRGNQSGSGVTWTLVLWEYPL